VSKAVLLAPGPSMSREVAEEALALRCAGWIVGAVTGAFSLAASADFLAATDAAWWRKFPEAKAFCGRKFSVNSIPGVEQFPEDKALCTSSSSGLLAIAVAEKIFGAEKILLLGFDHHGTHFFGPYKNGLSNTSKARREVHSQQFSFWHKRHPQVAIFNCTPNSRLTVFPVEPFREAVA